MSEIQNYLENSCSYDEDTDANKKGSKYLVIDSENEGEDFYVEDSDS